MLSGRPMSRLRSPDLAGSDYYPIQIRVAVATNVAMLFLQIGLTPACTNHGWTRSIQSDPLEGGSIAFKASRSTRHRFASRVLFSTVVDHAPRATESLLILKASTGTMSATTPYC